MGARRPLIAGNWKMYGRLKDLEEIAALEAAIVAVTGLDVAICPPLTLLTEASRRFVVSPVVMGAQDVSPGPDGAFTGSINAQMLADAGARYVIVGHSERRAHHGEVDDLIAKKAHAALEVGITPIICIGETLDERKAGQAVSVVERQLLGSTPQTDGEVVIAYEPVWAIGTGLTPSPADIAEIHAAIRAGLGPRAESTRILYGGSVKPANAAEIFTVENVDGALVGGASLKAADFSSIILAHPKARL
jgi:triosephosphate isomerase (TIM)